MKKYYVLSVLFFILLLFLIVSTGFILSQLQGPYDMDFGPRIALFTARVFVVIEFCLSGAFVFALAIICRDVYKSSK